ncbi:MAG TPA: DUF211 domain-containing protein [Solirubrobacteraceae bacterium]|jgi:hypothetical protein
MKIRRVRLDVDWAFSGPGIVAVAQAIDEVQGVQGANLTITEIDLETIGTDIAVEGEAIDLDELVVAIEKSGAVVHSIDQLVIGEWVVDYVPRVR